MKTAALALMLVVLVSPPALAHRHHHHVIGSCCGGWDESASWAPRCDTRAARLAITSDNGSVDLLLDRRVVALQLSDRTWHKIDRELWNEEREDEGWLADVIKRAVIGSVRGMLDHSLQYRLDELRDADYRDGRLVLTRDDGRRIFAGIEVEDDNVMASFSESDARAFVREFRRLKGLSD